ncbi:MAG: hypothetical protein WA584_23375 [Pyrinomonadaceae bacterium]
MHKRKRRIEKRRRAGNQNQRFLTLPELVKIAPQLVEEHLKYMRGSSARLTFRDDNDTSYLNRRSAYYQVNPSNQSPEYPETEKPQEDYLYINQKVEIKLKVDFDADAFFRRFPNFCSSCDSKFSLRDWIANWKIGGIQCPSCGYILKDDDFWHEEF